MNKSEMKARLQKNWLFYLLTILTALAMRSLCQINDSDSLTWILTPTARWAGILGGIPFEYLPHIGYVNHDYRFIIAPSCSGIRFLIITFLMLAFSFLGQFPSCRGSHRGSYRGSYWAKAFYLTGSVLFSYLYTIFANGVRIVIAIYLPIPLEQAGLLNGWLNSDRLHTLIGTVVYFSALCAVYPTAFYFNQYLFIQLWGSPMESQSVNASPDNSSPSFKPESRLLAPAFWYLLAVLVIPFAGRLLRKEWTGFGSYVLLICGACLVILVLSFLLRKLLHLHAKPHA